MGSGSESPDLEDRLTSPILNNVRQEMRKPGGERAALRMEVSGNMWEEEGRTSPLNNKNQTTPKHPRSLPPRETVQKSRTPR